jgi:hypothetical protein
VAGSLAPGRLESTPIDNPFGLAGPAGTVAAALAILGVLLHWGSLPAAAVCVVLRFGASRGIERQQMRWVAAGAAGAVAGLLLTLPGWSGLLPNATTFVIYPAMLCPPVAIAVAVLRYRLWDLDRLISRTVTYALVTTPLVLPYLLILSPVTRLAGGAGSLVVAPPPWPPRPPSSRCGAGSRTWSTGGSTVAAMTPPAPWTRSRPGFESRSTWTPLRPSCWPWSTRPCSRPRRRCGYAPRPCSHYRSDHPGREGRLMPGARWRSWPRSGCSTPGCGGQRRAGALAGS